MITLRDMPAKKLLLTLAIITFSACSRSSDEEQVRALIDAAEVAAEARDTSDVLALVTDEYRDDLGNDKEQLQGLLRGYFLIDPKIELIVSIKELKFETPNRARADINIAMVGTRGSDGQAALSADSQTLRIDLKRVDSEWRVAYVDRMSN